MSFLEMLDELNEELTGKGEEPVAFDSDCREGIPKRGAERVPTLRCLGSRRVAPTTTWLATWLPSIRNSDGAGYDRDSPGPPHCGFEGNTCGGDLVDEMQMKFLL